MQRHFDVTPFQIKPTDSFAVPLVVVGNATVLASNDDPHVIARLAVPVISMMSFWPSVGVPDRFVVIDVMAAV
jgi:hypothetical protein